MYGIFTYIGVVLGVNVGIYAIHGVSGLYHFRGIEDLSVAAPVLFLWEGKVFRPDSQFLKPIPSC